MSSKLQSLCKLFIAAPGINTSSHPRGPFYTQILMALFHLSKLQFKSFRERAPDVRAISALSFVHQTCWQ